MTKRKNKRIISEQKKKKENKINTTKAISYDELNKSLLIENNDVIQEINNMKNIDLDEEKDSEQVISKIPKINQIPKGI